MITDAGHYEEFYMPILPETFAADPRRRTASAAFTLIEVMISLAMMVLLMLGVNYIFSSVGKATSATQTMARVTRDAQSIGAVMSRDLGTADMKDAPFMLLRSQTMPAFRNKQDQLAAANQADPLVYYDPNDPTNATTLTYSSADYNERNHRTDIFSFFSRDTFRRQTGGQSVGGGPIVYPFIDDMTCGEAWIWYGHLTLPNNSTPQVFFTNPPSNSIPTNPGVGTAVTNPNNYYATQFTLGRMAMLLQEPDASGKIVSHPGTPQQAVEESIVRSGFLSPLSQDSMAGDGSPIYSSRYDLAATSMQSFWDLVKTASTPVVVNPPPIPPDWWSTLMLASRYQGSPFILGGPGAKMTPAAVARQAPIFVQGCTQFIVEYAGDFVRQERNRTLPSFGDVQAAYFDPTTGETDPNGTDGELDFFVKSVAGQQVKQIRWYGLPRDTDGDGVINGAPGVTSNNQLRDVVPLRDVIQTATGGAYANIIGAPFEKPNGYTPSDKPHSAPPTLVSRPDYADRNGSGMTPGEYYTCAWRKTDPKPWMIRITVVLDDPNGSLGQGQSFEYVFNLK